MKILKLLIAVLITGACAVSTHAQKLRYVPQAIKGAKAVPYVVKPELPTTVRTGFAMPVVRPNVAVAVERQVAAKVTVEERASRLEANLKKLEEYARTHNNRLPGRFSSIEDRALKRQVGIDMTTLRRNPVYENLFLRRYLELYEMDYKQADRERGFFPAPQKLFVIIEKELKQLEEISHANGGIIPDNFKHDVCVNVHNLIFYMKGWGFMSENHPFVQRYNRLIEKEEWVRKQEKERAQAKKQQREEQFIQEFRAQEMEQERRAWKQVLVQDKAWKAQPEEMADPTENATAAARLVEEQIAFPGTVPTDDYIDQLLQFYNKLDPYGTGTIQ